MRILATIFVLASSLVSFAAELPAFNQKIVGNEKPFPLGELVTLSVSPAEKVPGLVKTTYDWKVFEPTFEKKTVKVDLNGEVFFGAGVKNKKLLVVVAVTQTFEVTEDGKKSFVTRTVQISGIVVVGEDKQEEPPPVKPTPTPPQPSPPAAEQDPEFPSGKYVDLSVAAYRIVRTRVKFEKNEPTSLAAAFRFVASEIKKGSLKGQKDIFGKLAKENKRALGDGVASWEPFTSWLEESFFKLNQANLLETDTDYQQAFDAVADALEKVK